MQRRRLLGASALVGLFLAAAAPIAEGDATGAADQARIGSMQFAVRQESSPQCGERCQVWVTATGMIRAETARDFEAFAAKNDIRGATLVLNSEGGSVHGAIALGRAIRRLDMSTTVGRIVDVPAQTSGAKVLVPTLSTRADCESMCAFVLLAGSRRFVPADARVRVHQIWLGDRRDDAAAATYTAEDLVLVQRDIGKLAQYTVEMGGSVELLELSLRIPPWEPMRSLTRDEMRRMHLDNSDLTDARADAVQPSVASLKTVASLSSGTVKRSTPATQRGWVMAERGGAQVLTRRHPLTVEGDDLGSFDVTFTCGQNANEVLVHYTEIRRGSGSRAAQPLKSVEMKLGNRTLALAPAEVRPAQAPDEWIASATGKITPIILRSFAALSHRSLAVDASGAGTAPVVIRIGNTGAAQNVTQFLTSCQQPGRVEQAGLQ